MDGLESRRQIILGVGLPAITFCNPEWLTKFIITACSKIKECAGHLQNSKNGACTNIGYQAHSLGMVRMVRRYVLSGQIRSILVHAPAWVPSGILASGVSHLSAT